MSSILPIFVSDSDKTKSPIVGLVYEEDIMSSLSDQGSVWRHGSFADGDVRQIRRMTSLNCAYQPSGDLHFQFWLTPGCLALEPTMKVCKIEVFSNVEDALQIKYQESFQNTLRHLVEC